MRDYFVVAVAGDYYTVAAVASDFYTVTGVARDFYPVATTSPPWRVVAAVYAVAGDHYTVAGVARDHYLSPAPTASTAAQRCRCRLYVVAAVGALSTRVRPLLRCRLARSTADIADV